MLARAAILLQFAKYINFDKFKSRFFEDTLIRLVNFSIVMSIQDLVKFCPFILIIWSKNQSYVNQGP